MQPHECLESGRLRLTRALQRGSRHVAVWALDDATARAETRSALLGVDAAAIVHASAFHPDVQPRVQASTSPGGPGVGCRCGDGRRAPRRATLLEAVAAHAKAVRKPAFLVVEDAAEADAAALERICRAVDGSRADRCLCIVFVGDARLGRLFDAAAPSALLSQACEPIHVTRGGTYALSSATVRPALLDCAALVTLSVGIVALMAWPYLPAARGGPRAVTTGFPHAAAILMEDRVPQVRAEPVAGASPPHAAARRRPTVRRTEARIGGRGADEVRSGTKADLATDPVCAPFEARPLVDAISTSLAPPLEAVVAPAAGAAASPVAAPPEPGSDVPAVEADAESAAPAKRRDGGDAAAARESRSAPRGEHARGSEFSRGVLLEAALFEDVAQAYAARRVLARRFESVVVARVEGPQGPLYSVRVVGMPRSRDLAKAEGELRRLGYEPKRYAEPNSITRFSRRLWPAWASLF